MNPIKFINDSADYAEKFVDAKIDALGIESYMTIAIIVIIVYYLFYIGKFNEVSLMKSPIVKAIAFLVIIYASHHNVALALVLTIVLLTIMFKSANPSMELFNGNCKSCAGCARQTEIAYDDGSWEVWDDEVKGEQDEKQHKDIVADLNEQVMRDLEREITDDDSKADRLVHYSKRTNEVRGVDTFDSDYAKF